MKEQWRDGGDGREGNARNIEQYEEEWARKDDSLLLKAVEHLFNACSKGIKHQHVDSKVHIIGMKEGMGKDPVILFFLHNVVRREVEPVEKVPVPEGGHGNESRDNDNNQSDHG